jgi:hypothetical protein
MTIVEALTLDGMPEQQLQTLKQPGLEESGI